MMAAAEELVGLRSNVSLSRFTSLKVGGPADRFLEIRDLAQLYPAMRWANSKRFPLRWLGGGSNLLVSDEGVEGLVARVLVTAVAVLEEPSPTVIAESGASISALARSLARQGWTGLEWAANVPGTVGGAIVNNAGAFGSNVAETLLWTELLQADGSIERVEPADLCYQYRSSRLKRQRSGATVVLRGAFRIERADPSAAIRRVQELQSKRTASQPKVLSAGSVFANPPGDYAGRLIQEVGLKGARQGGAEISIQHGNFIVNHGGASASDVYALMRNAQVAVWTRFGTWLRPEIELVGRWTDAQRSALIEPAGREG